MRADFIHPEHTTRSPEQQQPPLSRLRVGSVEKHGDTQRNASSVPPKEVNESPTRQTFQLAFYHFLEFSRYKKMDKNLQQKTFSTSHEVQNCPTRKK